MPDRGLPVQLGVFPEPVADRLDDVLAMTALAEELGLDLVGVQDHPYQRRFLDTFTLLTWLAARTERIRLFPDVANLPLRGAAMLAKAGATIDRLSGGRFELGLGAGGFWDAIAALGGPRRTPGEAVQATEEAIAVIRALWSAERGLRVGGDHYRLDGVHGGPTPAHDIGIWIGALGPRMLDLTGRLADGWVPSLPFAPPERLPDLQARIDEAAEAAGRDAAAIRRVYNVTGRITNGARGDGPLDGPVDHWVEQLAGLVDLGMDTFVLWPDLGDEVQVRRYAEEVAPALRAAVARARR